MDNLDRINNYKKACDYPGEINADAVNDALNAYCSALGIKRVVRRLVWPWRDEPDIRRMMSEIYDRVCPTHSLQTAARAATDARAARDARDALASRFELWCVWRGGYWYWDLSWISTTSIGARQLKLKSVSAWSDCLFDAFVSGAWFLIWTKDVLFWVSKPALQFESSPSLPSGKQLHNDSGPAVICDVENLYYIHGVQVPADVVMTPHLLTVAQIDAEDDNDIRAIMLDRFGAGRYIVESGAEVVEEGKNEVEGTHEALMRTPNGRKFFWPTCPSGRVCPPLPVPDTITNREEARRWLNPFDGSCVVFRT